MPKDPRRCAAPAAGLVEERSDRWRLTADGRAEGERLLRVELDAAEARLVVVDAHQHERLAGELERDRSDAPRCSTAHGRIEAGDTAALDEPSPDSYHGVWFELHDAASALSSPGEAR